ncbi:unnamed protein product [Rotaria sordida]|uniref:Uncharacterized protein n=1 Tax=Rotaria sordida TaxID=392033 RepID=A0A813RD67_9BILA|nr:unnamed protein product [Rotaria sordida]
MPTGHYYSQETKELIFNVIQFIEGEKNGPKTPLYNVNDRIMAALQISHGSMAKLKNEMKQLQEEQQMVLEHKLLEQQHQQQHQAYELAQKYKTERLRPRSSSPFITPKNDHFTSMDTPRTAAKSPLKHGDGASLKISLTEYEEDLIRQVSTNDL